MIKKLGAGLALVIMMGAGLAARAQDLCPAPVATESGQVRGKADEATATCTWKGIPFAAPPVGELRFRAPRPAPAWTGVRDAYEYGSRCVQVLAPKGTMSEDCLYLNVWRPNKSGAFPVMVWIHGGGYIMGSGGGGRAGSGGYNGGRLSEFGDVVVVTINYRLHALGYLADAALAAEDEKGSTGSYGSLDQAFALKWVHDNIANFGGDPGNVTIFGESAGGWSICTMLATPLNRGLFQRAILESGGCQKAASLEAGYEQGRKIAARVGCSAGDLPCLRKVPAEKFIGGAGRLYREGMSYAPHIDNYLLPALPLTMIRAGNYNQVPFLAGFNRNEVDAVLVFRPELWHARPVQYEAKLKKYLGVTDAEADQIARLYPLSDFADKPRKAYGKIFTDLGLACPTYLGLSSAAAHQPAAYFYRFDYNQMKFGRHTGALHAMEVPFVFNSIEAPSALYNERNVGPARELARSIEGYWVNFAKTGDPNGPGLPAWPRFDPKDQKLLVLDTSIRAEPAGMAERCAFWDGYARTHRGMEESLGSKSK